MAVFQLVVGIDSFFFISINLTGIHLDESRFKWLIWILPEAFMLRVCYLNNDMKVFENGFLEPGGALDQGLISCYQNAPQSA